MASFIIRMIRRLWGESLWSIFLHWTTSDVYVSWDDSLYGAVLRVFYSNELFLPTNKCTVRTIRSSNNKEVEDELDKELCAWGASGTFTQQSQILRQFFRYRGRMFFLHDEPEDRRSVIRCLGWSNKPIEIMLEDEFASYKTEFARRATELSVPRNNHSGSWRTCTHIPMRGLDSVEMDGEEKAALISDIASYLEGKEWYRSRCVPWRRGYLFHGPPGTGKTSIVKAIAGPFRLPICALALSSGLDDSNLQLLCRRATGLYSIVLLEDIDSAGLERPSQAGVGAANQADTENKTGDDKTGDEVMTEKNNNAPLSKESDVTLAGLLNAIDGVGAPEGQILIMTSNYVENLDPALTRPGRIDYRLKFDLATKEQAKSIFLRLQAAKDGDSQLLTKLNSMAQTFADRVPEKLLSPADLQDFILRRRDDPQKVLDEVDNWVEEKLVAEKGTVQEAEETNSSTRWRATVLSRPPPPHEL